MSNYIFPTNIPEPKIPYASDAGDTYNGTISDSTISSTTDANYKVTRPRTTRVVRTWTYTWTMLSADDFNIIRDFWLSVRTSEMFQFTDYDDGKEYTVRFTGKFAYTNKLPPDGYVVSLAFEEV